MPGSDRLQTVALKLRGVAQLDVAHAEVEREAVEELEQLVVPPPVSGLAAELRLLLGHERVDLVLRLRRPGEAQARIQAVALPVDAGPVHRDEQARILVLLRDRRDARAVEGEVRADVDLEEGDRLSVGVDARRLLPDRPAVVVTFGGDDERRGQGVRQARAKAAERSAWSVCRTTCQASPRSRTIIAPALCVPASSSRCATTSSTETTSPYFASMS